MGYIVGNWKMNGLTDDIGKVVKLIEMISGRKSALPQIVICPPTTLLSPIAELLAGHRVAVGGQDCSRFEAGAHTGDISPLMLADIGAAYCILGHSERRAAYGEDSLSVRAKAEAVIAAGMTPVICVGETAQQRQEGGAIATVTAMARTSLPARPGPCLLAYEPVWAIGSGQAASKAAIAEMHQALRDLAGPGTPLLYGGSVNPGNAAELAAIDNLDGFLVGGASLDPESFIRITAQVEGTAPNLQGEPA